MVRFVLGHHDEPLLFFYSADATPVSTKEAFVRSLGDHTIRRKGRASKELLIQRLFCLAADGSCRVVLDEPRPMADKTAWTHTQAYRDLFDFPRSLGHGGILIHHYVWDRAIHSACWRQIRQLHRASELEGGSNHEVLPQNLLHL